MRSAALLSVSLLAALTACSTDSSSTSPAAPAADLNVSELSGRRGNDRGGNVYVLSNNTTANAVLAYRRGADGKLTSAGSVATGGRGTGAGLGNQYGLILDDDGETLLGVNAGSNDISVFRVRDGVPYLTDRVSSGGDEPISIAIRNHLVYVLNDGAKANITGFFLTERGRLLPLPYTTRARSAPAGSIDGAEIAFSPDGRSLVVTEKAANIVVSYPVQLTGRTGEPRIQHSTNATPFGFDFAPNGTVVVSEAAGAVVGASSVSSFSIDHRANLSLSTASLPNGQTSACWIAVSENGRTAYVANTNSGTISTLGIARSNGALSLTNAVAGQTGTGSSPSDMALSAGDRYLYVRSGATNSVVIFATGENGTLSLVDTLTDLPAGANGLAAR